MIKKCERTINSDAAFILLVFGQFRHQFLGNVSAFVASCPDDEATWDFRNSFVRHLQDYALLLDLSCGHIRIQQQIHSNTCNIPPSPLSSSRFQSCFPWKWIPYIRSTVCWKLARQTAMPLQELYESGLRVPDTTSLSRSLKSRVIRRWVRRQLAHRQQRPCEAVGRFLLGTVQEKQLSRDLIYPWAKNLSMTKSRALQSINSRCIFSASNNSFMKHACSFTPGMLKVCTSAPTAYTR